MLSTSSGHFFFFLCLLQPVTFTPDICAILKSLCQKIKTLNKLNFKLVHACGQIFGFYLAHNWKLVDSFTTSRHSVSHTLRIPPSLHKSVSVWPFPLRELLSTDFSWRHCCCSCWTWRGSGAPKRCCFQELCECWA